MCAVKGCFVCGKDHLARQLHARSEITEAIEKLKAQHYTSLLSAEILAAFLDRSGMDGKGQFKISEDWIQRASVENDDEWSITLVPREEGAGIEQVFATSSFLHGRGSKQADILSHGSNLITRTDAIEVFSSLRIDTCSNGTLVIVVKQFRVYISAFKPPYSTHDAKESNSKTDWRNKYQFGGSYYADTTHLPWSDH